MAKITVTVRLFGAFRSYGESIAVSVPAGSTAAAVKAKLAETLDGTLVGNSVLANDNEVLADDAVFTQDSQLAILPPVCGG